MPRCALARPWQLYEDFERVLIDVALPLYANEPLGMDLRGARVVALDSSTLELCLSLFGWAAFRPTKATVIKSFLGTSANAVRTQIWIALSAYLMCAVAEERLGLHSHSLHDMLRVIELNLFEPVPIADLLNRLAVKPNDDHSMQTELF